MGNAIHIGLNFEIGKLIVKNQEINNWGKSIVDTLSTDINKQIDGIKGYSPQNLWRMRQFYLEYKDDTKPAISRLKRYSRPSRREYVKANDIPNIRAGYGMAILSTSKGIMSAGQAKDSNVGGELLCVVW